MRSTYRGSLTSTREGISVTLIPLQCDRCSHSLLLLHCRHSLTAYISNHFRYSRQTAAARSQAVRAAGSRSGGGGGGGGGFVEVSLGGDSGALAAPLDGDDGAEVEVLGV